MKKVLYTLAGMAMIALGVVSCQKETSFEAGKDGSVTFTVNLPGVETKAISDGTTATKLDFAIYDGDGKYLEELTASAQKSDFDGKKATVTVQVIKDLTYQFVFFAKAAENSPYTFAPADKKLSIDYGAANLEAADAFYYATEPIVVKGAFSRDITLTRPLAQINFGSSESDLAAAKLSNIDVDRLESSLVLTNVYSQMDLLTGELTGEPTGTVTLTEAVKPADSLKVKKVNYGWIAMAYILAGDKDVTDLTLGVKTTADGKDISLTREVANVPYQRNHRTNILGNIFSYTASFNIEIDSNFDEPDYQVTIPVWSGTTDPNLNTDTDPIIITTAEELAQLAYLVNSGTTFLGKTVELANDLNLGNKEWTPIGGSAGSFKGTFNGNNHTISNLKITGSLENEAANNYKGLFGYLGSQGSLKNIKIENAIVSGSLYIGGLLGRGYSAKTIENCEITGKIEINAWWYAGGIAGRPEYMTAITDCRVDGDPGSYVKSTTGSYIGGIAGFIAEGSQKTENCYTNIDVTGVDRTGGLVGIAHYGNTVNNNVVDNITLTSLNDISSIGAIAGCAQFTNNSQATITNNTFSGTIITKAALQNGAVVGYDYQGNTNEGHVTLENNIINYKHQIADGLEYDNEGQLIVTSGAGLQYLAQNFKDFREDVDWEGETLPSSLVVNIAENLDMTGIDFDAFSANGYTSAEKVVNALIINGNNHSIKNLNRGLVRDTWAGKSRVKIQDVIIEDANIDESSSSGKGTAAIIGWPQASSQITISNCHVKNSTIKGGSGWTGGIIGYANGYSGTDGPVFENVEINNCSVEGCTLSGKGSVGSFMGHATGDAWTKVTVSNSEAKDNVISTTSADNKAGKLFGTIGVAGTETTTNGVSHTGGTYVVASTWSNITVTDANGAVNRTFGRVSSTGGKYYIDGELVAYNDGDGDVIVKDVE